MPRHKGTPKTGGRKKGTKNKAAFPVAELCNALGCNPIEVLIEFCQSKNPSHRFMAARELAQYLQPKRRAIDISAPGLEDAIKNLSEDQLNEKIRIGLEKLNGKKLD